MWFNRTRNPVENGLGPIPDGTDSTGALSEMRRRKPLYTGDDGPQWSLENTGLTPDDVARAVEALGRDEADWHRPRGDR